ncbi:MAG: PD-(D/E)XK nuclease domain-containing protein [Desulfotignum sp.]|nr:PD-(D/E)XK nuclease domain-containing protein [Desulfotignum sp.]
MPYPENIRSSGGNKFTRSWITASWISCIETRKPWELPAGTPGTALEQLHKKGYADKYRAQHSDIYLIGVEFDRNERNIVRFEWEAH